MLLTAHKHTAVEHTQTPLTSAFASISFSHIYLRCFAIYHNGWNMFLPDSNCLDCVCFVVGSRLAFTSTRRLFNKWAQKWFHHEKFLSHNFPFSFWRAKLYVFVLLYQVIMEYSHPQFPLSFRRNIKARRKFHKLSKGCRWFLLWKVNYFVSVAVFTINSTEKSIKHCGNYPTSDSTKWFSLNLFKLFSIFHNYLTQSFFPL